MPAGNRPSDAAVSRVAATVKVALALAVLAGLGGASALPARDEPPPPAPLVSAIEVRTDAPLDVDPAELLAFGVGDRLDEVVVRRTLSNAHAVGRFDQVALLRRAGEAPGTVVAVLVLEAPTRVRRVVLAGEPGVRSRLLRREIRQAEGAVLEEERVIASVYALQDLYRRRGHFEARVRLEVRPAGDGSGRVDVVFHLDGGPRARLGGVELAGASRLAQPAEVLDALRGRVGRAYDPERLDEERRRLRRFLVERGHLTARVGEPRELYDAERREVTVVFPVEPGPVIEVEVEGLDRRRLERRELLPFLADEPFDEVALERACAEVRHDLQRRGHYHARVDCAFDAEATPPRVRLAAEPGPELELVAVRFEGNRQVGAEALERLMSTSPGAPIVFGSLFPGAGRLVSRDLETDLENLRSYYLLQGFAEARVGPARVEQIDAEITLVIPIHEGPRRRLVDLELVGVEAFDPAELVAKLPLRAGGPFHPLLLDDSVNVLRALYEDEGFASPRVTRRVDTGADGQLVSVRLEVEEGPRTRVDRLILRGLVHTHARVVRRFAGLEPGDVLSRRRLLEAERDLYRLGIFSEVDVEAAPVGSSPARRDVVLHLEEARRWRLSYGLSYHSDDGVGGLLGVVRHNLGGRGAKWQLDLRASANDRRARLVYDEPSLGELRWPLTGALFVRDEDRVSYSVRETGSQVALVRDREPLRLELIYAYRLVGLEESVADPAAVERQDREVEISSLTPLVFVDRRDDPVDPSRGWSTAVQLEWAFPLLGADTDFLKLFWQQTAYRDVGPLGVLASSLRLGALEPLDAAAAPDPLVPPELASSRVPVSERFFAGGRTTHRAYERDRLGIPGQSLVELDDGRLVEAGGNGLVLWNLDWRFPISGPVGGVVFFDVGNVWADWRDIDADELRPGAGVGVRYASPIGPVRVEVGWKLDPRPDEDDAPVFFLSFGNPF